MSASSTSPPQPLDPEPTSSAFRARLGEYVAHVHAHDAQVRLTAQGRPAGVLMSLPRAQQAGYQVHGTWSVYKASVELPRVRERAADQGPQQITGRTGASAVLVASAQESALDPEPPMVVLRDKLGDYVAHVHAHDAQIPVTVGRRRSGALVSVERVQRAGLQPAGAWTVERARQELATARERAADQGPQVITSRTGASAALISVEHVRVLEDGHPVLETDEVTFDSDGHTVRTADGHPLAPGTYTFAGVVHVIAPHDSPGHD